MKKISCLLLLATLFGSCASNEVGNSGDVNQETIYQNYSIDYTEENNETHVRATFRFGGENGTTLILTPPSVVLFNKENMTRYQSEFTGVYYETAFNHPLPNGATHTFVFTDTLGKKYTNSIKSDAVLVGKVPTEIEKGMPLTFLLVTNPLAFGEKLVIHLSDSSTSKDFVVEQNQLKKEFVLPATVLKNFSGTVTMKITRSYTAKLQEATPKGGIISYNYSLKPYSFTIK